MKQLNLIEVNYRDAVNSGNVSAAIEKAVTARIGELIIEGATLNDFIKHYPSIIPVGIPLDWSYDEGKQIDNFYRCIHIRENKTFLDSELTLDQLETLFCRTYGSSSKQAEKKVKFTVDQMSRRTYPNMKIYLNELMNAVEEDLSADLFAD